jgi:hypothetical protein
MSLMDEQPQTSDFTTHALGTRIAIELSDNSRSIHKRSWPFESDDQQYTPSDSASLSACQPDRPLQLLGSVSY